MSVEIVSYQIPFAAGSAWFQRPVTLQGVTYTLEFQYNARVQRWYMDILDIAEQPLLRGIRLEIDTNLNGQYGSYALPKGFFAVKDTTGQQQPATLNSFSVDHVLLFLDVTT